MNSEQIRQDWILAGALLASEPTEKVKCPECKQYFLDIFDEDVDSQSFERHLKCPECDGHEVLFLSKLRHKIIERKR